MKPNFVSLCLALSLCLLAFFGHAAAATKNSGATAATINVAFVTDLSGSMKVNQLVEPTQSFLKTFFGELFVGDRVILVDFGTEIGVNKPINVSERNQVLDIAELGAVVDGYEFKQQFTYTSGALAEACQALSRQRGPKALILLTDGKEEIPQGSDARWDKLPKVCSGSAIHVVALTKQSMPTVQQIGNRLGATVHDATKKSLVDIGNDIRAGIRVFVTADKENFELGNLKLNEAAEMRAQFSLTGASSQVMLKPIGKFPAGANFTCQAFSVPGDMRCQLVVTDKLQPGSYSGTISFEPTVGNLAVVVNPLEVNFSRGLLKIQVSEEDISLGAMRPGSTQTVSVDFTSDESAEPQPLALVAHGFPEGTVTVEPAQIMVPAQNVELKFTFNGGDPGQYVGQLTLLRQSTTMVVEPATISLSFSRRTWLAEWFWHFWYLIIPGIFLNLVLLYVLYRKYVVEPRQQEQNKPFLKGRLVRPDGTEEKLNSTLQEQTVDELIFVAEGTRANTRVLVKSSIAIRVRFSDGNERFAAANHSIKLIDRAVILASDGSEIGTFRCMDLRK